MLKYLKNEQIDRTKWNNLVNSSPNATIYNYIWYLDTLCSWDAIILNDYEGAIALPYKQKLGIKQLIQPAFLQHCSWIGEVADKSELSQLILKHFNDIRFNSYTELDLESESRVSIILDLNRSSDDLYDGFKKDLKKNIRKGEDQLSIIETDDPSHCIQLYKKAYGDVNALSTEDYDRFRQLFRTAYGNGKAICYNVLHNNEVIASLCFMRSHQRMHYVLGAPNDQGKKLNALSMVFWHIIQKHAGTKMQIDFEGSSIPSVARFYSSFGAEPHHFKEYTYSKGVVKIARKLLK